MSNAPGFDGTQPCADYHGDFFFPETQMETRARLPKLRGICSSCDFRVECLTYALERPLEGFWGGMTQQERSKLRKLRKISLVE